MEKICGTNISYLSPPSPPDTVFGDLCEALLHNQRLEELVRNLRIVDVVAASVRYGAFPRRMALADASGCPPPVAAVLSLFRVPATVDGQPIFGSTRC